MKDSLVEKLLRDTASAIVQVVKKNKYLLVTTLEMKVMCCLRRHFYFLWYALIKLATRLVDRAADEYRL